MPVINAISDLETCSLTIVAEFSAPVERIWAIYADPRQLERVFGPPTYPAKFVDHDLVPGGRAHYYMTSPEGEKYYGWWKITEVEEPHRFVFEDGFAADETFAPREDMPVSHNVYTFAAIDGGTRATYVSSYATADALQQVLDMGVIEGASGAINQIDVFLA
jgi:uncharacterized protein YndB with AHSA1/START domain